jgi:hypothetical protein
VVLGTTLWLCSCKRKARQGKARRKREAKAKPAQAQICGSPRLGLVWFGLPEWEVQTGGGWWVVVVAGGGECLLVNNGRLYTVYGRVAPLLSSMVVPWWRERGGALSQRAESLAVTYPCVPRLSIECSDPPFTELHSLHSIIIAKNTSIVMLTTHKSVH